MDAPKARHWAGYSGQMMAERMAGRMQMDPMRASMKGPKKAGLRDGCSA